MAVLGDIFSAVYGLLQIQFTIWGHTLTGWNIFAFTIVTPIVATVIWGVISGGD